MVEEGDDGEDFDMEAYLKWRKENENDDGEAAPN